MKQSQAEAGLVCLAHDDFLRVVAMDGFDRTSPCEGSPGNQDPAVKEALATGQPQCSYRTISDFGRRNGLLNPSRPCLAASAGLL
jgi:hypothetical protein